MDFDNMDFDKWNKNDLIELMNTEEFMSLMEWEQDPESFDGPDLFGDYSYSYEEVIFYISKDALKREMSQQDIDWNRVKRYKVCNLDQG